MHAKAGPGVPQHLPRSGLMAEARYYRDPAQSVAMMVVTDGLLPQLGINRFHARCQRSALLPTRITCSPF